MEDSVASSFSAQAGVLLAATLLAVFVVWRLVRLSKPVQAFLKRYPWGSALIDLVLFPAAVFGAGRLLGGLLGLMDLPAWQEGVREITELLIILSISSGIARLIELWLVFQNPEQRSERRDTKLSQLGRTVLFGLCLFVGFLVYLYSNDRVPTELFLSAGALAAVVAFAMQQTLGDLFSGIALSIEKPFKIGDWLRFSDGMEGEVTDINWRATRLRGWDNTTYVVPNGQLSQQSFTNLHGPEHLFAPWYLVKVSGDADPHDVKALLERAASHCDTVLQDPAPVARLMDGTSNPYTYMVWVHFSNYPAMFAGREQLYGEIHRTLKGEGLQISAEIHEIRHRAVGTETG
ncbi:mechanosensitive ion channel family protein [Falsiruegeria mediterranea]|uniref:Small-conductance mechanosensitive channel n=1 Tax=Falsiruegeria mediterranea M17 TaxID=1200281 RepID=A0A2R8CG90_9RHOB|nr:mechanosensitive ion channel family protein [Falsiruegeria mediterranea]SPJ31441.1 Miniconductance mechanosensitive channel MscM [Falsiruegeria mediterranea M17]